jgi:two-component system sensor histidine kinase CiaH
VIQSAVLKLTAWYVGALMFVCIVFSIVLYDVNTHEIERNTHMLPPASYFQDMDARTQFREDREQEYQASVGRLQENLIILNIATLVIGSVVGYFFARWTLQPVKEALESQARFASDASHELRTPLTAMQAEIEVTLRDPSTSKKEYQALLRSNLEEIQILKNMSSSLLQLTRGEQAKDQFSAVHITDVLQICVKRFEAIATIKHITLLLDIRSQNVQVYGDKQSLVELFSILIDNALKYSPSKSTITMSVDQQNKHVNIMVSDQGIGINKSDIPHIYDRFYRSDDSRTKFDTPGFGLGLAIAKQIADLHGAHINVVSEPGKGTQFIVSLALYTNKKIDNHST